ncbi:hypothetical protein EON65_24295 [archaeon]|nr:MAG: hypothetical protein EON65_24295 [archaeon]
MDEGHPAATAHCALAKKIATDQVNLINCFILHRPSQHILDIMHQVYVAPYIIHHTPYTTI